jgi:hypothetical protein
MRRRLGRSEDRPVPFLASLGRSRVAISPASPDSGAVSDAASLALQMRRPYRAPGYIGPGSQTRPTALSTELA